MQEKLADIRSRFLTRVSIKVKPSRETPNDDDILPASFKILNSEEMGMAKQIVINHSAGQLIACADHITRPSDTQADFYETSLAPCISKVITEGEDSDFVIGIVGE